MLGKLKSNTAITLTASPNSNNSRILATTAIEETWPKDEPILFLGGWCKIYDRKHIWETLDSEVAPYHWDDREKLFQDYNYLKNLHERLLTELVIKLNETHNVSLSSRYWRILIGPWLGYFVQSLFDRWTMIEHVCNHYNVTGLQTLNTPIEQIIPNDKSHFMNLLQDDLWNEAICSELIQKFFDVPTVDASLSRSNLKPSSLLKVGRIHENIVANKKLSWISSFSKLQGLFTKENEAFFLSTYLPRSYNFLLQIKLGQIPKEWKSCPTPSINIDLKRRKWQLGNSNETKFERVVRLMIPKHIPRLYLEGYSDLNRLINTLPWPQKPRAIFSSNSWSHDDIFKGWAAEKVEEGAKLFLGQHGGNYGTALWNFTEDHQLDVADTFISWGWGNNNPKIKPALNLKTVNRRQKWNEKGNLLLVCMTLPRYFYNSFSGPVASQTLNYLNEQFQFALALQTKIRHKLIVRLNYHDFGWCQHQRWQEQCPDVKLDDGLTKMSALISNSRIFVSTYNATTFLESLSMNVPTIIFWNPEYWELRKEAIPYFNRLKEVGIFHHSPESAAEKVALVWDEVEIWWDQPDIQKARKYFCHQFSRTVDNPLEILKKILQ